jgi:putative transposase
MISCTLHRFPPVIIQHAIWLYFRFPLSFRDVDEMLAERGIEVSYETVRRCVLKFGPAFAANIKSSRPRPSATWHLDEVFVRICGKSTYLWRAVDDEGEVLEVLHSLGEISAHLEIDAETIEETGIHSRHDCHRQTGFLRSGAVGTWPGAPSCHRRSIDQSGRKFTPTDAPKRAPNGSVQVARIDASFLSVHDAIYNHFTYCPAAYVHIPKRGQRHLISRRILRQTRA